MTIASLINKQDGFEIVRDQIAAIIALESASQQALAHTAGENKALWKMRVFTERSGPFEEWLNPEDLRGVDKSPIVNIWYDNGSFPMNKGNTVERQLHEATFNVDCYGVGFSADDPSGGHVAGDQEAAIEAQRAVKLIRNILMASEYTYLGLRGTVWRRWPQSITVFQPQIDGRPVQRVVGARISLRVDFNEFSPQAVPETLELLSVNVKRSETGEVLAVANFDYTT